MDEVKNSDVEQYFNLLNSEGVDKSKGWRKSTEVKEGKKKPYSCTIWMRPIPGSKIKLMRSELVFKGISMK